jgi:2-phospho-L-lactate guanylyltransferase
MSELGRITPVQAWALVPVKSPIWAKTRLAGLLSEAERARLQWAMLQDMLDQLGAVESLSGVAIVCPDPRIQAMALARGLRVFGDEPVGGGLNAALAYGTARLRAAGADLVMVLPGDVPLLDAADIDHAIRTAIHENTAIVVPDHQAEGTNALVFWADRPPRFRFGRNSFALHLADTGQGPVQALPLASIARDIDWPDDLDALRRRRWQGDAPNTNSALAGCAYLTAPVLTEQDS